MTAFVDRGRSLRVVRTSIEGGRVTIPIPDNPGGPPDNRSAFKSMETVMPTIVRLNSLKRIAPPWDA